MSYAYHSPDREAYPNLKEAAEAGWIGATALIQGQPYLVIGKTADGFVLEGEEGTPITAANYDWWTLYNADTLEQNKLVAASRMDDSPLKQGAKFDEVFMGPLEYNDGTWQVLTQDGSAVVPIEEFVERLADANWMKQAQDSTLLWLLEKDGSVIFAPAAEVHSHPGLIYANYGSDPSKQDLYGGIYSAMGEVRNGQVHLSSILPPRFDQSPTQWEAIKVGRQVRTSLRQNGVNTSMTMTASMPGEGDVEIPMYTAEKLRQVNPVDLMDNQNLPGHAASLTGEFVKDGTGETVQFSEVQHFGSDKELGAEEYWEVQGNDGNVYFINEAGNVLDQDDDIVGFFQPYAKTADFEDEHLGDEHRGPQLVDTPSGNTIMMQLPASGIHIGTHNMMQNAGLHCQITYPPTSAFPDGLTTNIPGDLDKDMQWGFSHWDDNGGVKPMDDVNVQLTSDDPEAAKQVIYQSDSRGRRERQPQAAYLASDTDGITCPSCGSHTYRAQEIKGQEGLDLHCLTCGNAWQHEAVKAPSHLAAAAHEPGTRVEVVHPSNKGQKGSILKHKGTDSAVDEDTYDILLDSGEKIEGLRASDINRIKSARFNTDEHFLESLPIIPKPNDYGYKQSYDEHLDPDIPIDNQEWTCPECGHDDFDVYQGQAQCKNCGATVAVEDLKHPDVSNGYGDEYIPGQLRGQETYYSAIPNQPGQQFNTNPPMQQVPQQAQPQQQVQGREACPSCGGNNVMLANIDPSTQQPMYHCNNCGTIFSGQPQASVAKVAFSDRDGNPLTAGGWYVMRSQNYKVPDVVQILNLEENRIEAAIEGDNKGSFPLHILHDDIDKQGYSFEPYKHKIEGLPAPTGSDDRLTDIQTQITDLLDRKRQGDPTVDEPELNALMKQYFAVMDATQNAQEEQMQQQQVQPSALPTPPNSQPGQMLSGWHFESRKNFTPGQQRDLVNENMGGRARNFDKLNLSGTHYELRQETRNDLDEYFLFGL